MTKRLAILGLGTRGMQLVEAVRNTTGVCLEAGYTRNHHNGVKLSRELDMPVYTDWHDLLASVRPDAVLVATPVKAHNDMIRTSLERGVHVYVESPPAYKEKAVRNQIDLAEKHDLKLAYSQEERFFKGADTFVQGLTEVLQNPNGSRLVWSWPSRTMDHTDPTELRQALFLHALPLVRLIAATGVRTEGVWGQLLDNGPVLGVQTQSGEVFEARFTCEPIDVNAKLTMNDQGAWTLEQSETATQRLMENFVACLDGEGTQPIQGADCAKAVGWTARAVEHWLKAWKESRRD